MFFVVYCCNTWLRLRRLPVFTWNSIALVYMLYTLVFLLLTLLTWARLTPCPGEITKILGFFSFPCSCFQSLRLAIGTRSSLRFLGTFHLHFWDGKLFLFPLALLSICKILRRQIKLQPHGYTDHRCLLGMHNKLSAPAHFSRLLSNINPSS